MPRFFFHLCDDKKRVEDYKGHDFETAGSAQRAAEQVARDFLTEELLKDHEPDGRRFEIEDTHGRRIATVRLKDLLPPEPNA